MYEHKRHSSDQHLMHYKMVFGDEFWILTVTDQKRVVSGLHPFKAGGRKPAESLTSP